MDEKKKQSDFLRRYLEEETPILVIRTPKEGINPNIGKKNFAELSLDGYPGLAFDDFKTNLHQLTYDDKTGTLQISVAFTREKDYIGPNKIEAELASASFSIPINIDVVIAIIKDWTNKVNRVRTVLEAIKKE